MRRSDKRGIELSMNVVVIAILVILVLIFVALFFTGGFSTVVERIKTIFQSQPIDAGIIRSKCDGFCSEYNIISGLSAKQDIWNEYCTVDRDVDINSNGKIDPGEKKSCDEVTTCISIDCSSPP